MSGRASEQALRRAYRVLLRAYPRSFRDEWGEDVEHTFVDRYRDAARSGARATARYLLAAVVDAIASGVRERLDPPPAQHTPGVAMGSMFHWQDVRYAFRLLRRSPLFTLLTVIVLGGGLGLSIFTFSFLYAAMLRPLPLPGGAQVMRVMAAWPGRDAGDVDAADVAAVRGQLRALTDVGTFDRRELVLGSDGARRVVHAFAVEWNVFEVTRTPAALGRGFRAEDGAPGAEPAIVLGQRTWRAAFGADSAIVGRLVEIGGTPTRVLGVMPPGYGFPVAADAWVPMGRDVLTATVPGVHMLGVYGRVAPGVSVREAEAELGGLLDRTRRGRPGAESGGRPTRAMIQSFPMAQIGEEAPLVLSVLNLLATLVLLLACINVTNLLLARANERVREAAVRLALGAPRARLVMQGLWESVLLCLAGGAVAVALAGWGLTAVNAWAQTHLPDNLAFWWVWGFDRTVLVAAGGFVTLAIAVLGGVVSMRATTTALDAVLRDSGARAGGRSAGRLSRALVVTQVATVSVLMFFGVMAGIVANRVAHMDVGFDTRNLLSAGVGAAGERWATPAARLAYLEGVHDGLARSPAVDGVLLRAALADIGDADAELELDGATPGGARPRAYVQGVLGALGTLGVAVREGRALERGDREGAVPVAVVSQAFARRHWPRGSAVGKRVRLAGLGERGAGEWRAVVGVVGDVPLGNPLSRERSAEAVYVPLAQRDVGGAVALFRHRGDATAARTALQRAMADLDPTLPPPDVATYAEILEKSALMARAVARLFAACFGFALVLAVSGTYGLMARAIGQRTREIGVRRALGATDNRIVATLLGQGGRQLGVGALAALPLMLAVGGGFAHYVPIGLALPVGAGVVVAATIVGVVLAATYVPTRRVLGITPRDALWRD